MSQTLRSIFLITFLFVASSVFAQNIASIIESAPNHEALWSVTVRDTGGNILEAYNSDKLIVPASNQKLFTTATVLDGLGSKFSYTTKIYGDGKLVDSVWNGNLIIRGSGDPSISGFMYNGDREYVFKSILEQLKQKGIKKISGELIANTGLFSWSKYPKGWDWDDLSFYYGVEIAPLSFNNNAIDLIVNADGNVGSKPNISWFPYQTDFVEFFNQQKIIEPDKKYDEEYIKYPGENKFHLGSKLPKGYLEEESLAISNAHEFFLISIDAFFNRNGIKTKKMFNHQNIDTPNYWNVLPILASHTSVSLEKLVNWANKESDNFYTEMLLRTLSSQKTAYPDFEFGIKEVRNFLGRMEIDTTYVIMKDGSGMASGNFTKTSIISEFLVKMKSHPEFPAFFNSMSVAGIDGTIAHRMKGTPFFNNFKGKSGYVGGVRVLSGYVKTASGQELIVSLAANNFIGKVKPIDAVHEEILAYLYSKY